MWPIHRLAISQEKKREIFRKQSKWKVKSHISCRIFHGHVGTEEEERLGFPFCFPLNCSHPSASCLLYPVKTKMKVGHCSSRLLRGTIGQNIYLASHRTQQAF
ncbi:hypothetical protein H112_01585 [Trichophyton rubrum D6]|uniref:Uncharacterized protein n=3 Tax=Trichophyton TaxID=5550 RepID=A0A080WLL9_TRIRC|nr:uncharacterized protein TERG_12531 [Trichophyton rubrum CBS 118892]EZF26382.1 hypothetical protein H100_01581 [Trichophyton rubrum MR850]EZF45281.1 hypothetical protein H102_01576 [Trichophyton rubrum CBS 100081]EZF55963.1 hypothetical protein H103_01589 [Trichophyton rubrum CBS 288.86]EZF66662.1 hypothetical protein H104_01564 [Trichophyton rubrum CBS 289.86]EZF77272.1 hypothetical protein H105_01592 [Trichophyton soudanense CBS 452.61]EZF87961.1 hypothetical protein H110_01584 [Trichophy